MRQYEVTGMSCAACRAAVERAVGAVEGVASCTVNLLTGQMAVEGTATDEAVVAAVQKAGYGARVRNGGGFARQTEELSDKETPALRRRLWTSAVLLLVLVYCSMGHAAWGFPLPAFFDEKPVFLAALQMLLAAGVMLIQRKFFLSGFRGLFRGAPNMDTLVALGSGTSFLWSTYVLIRMATDTGTAAERMGELYFSSAAMILVLIAVGKTLEARSKGKTTDALRALYALAPKTARVLRGGKEVLIPAQEVAVGDIFLLRPGDSVPADGEVLSGTTAVNEAMLTGESLPVDKAPGDALSAATVNLSGRVECRATKVGEDTALAAIIRTVSDAAATRAPIARIADRVSGVFVPVVMAIAAVTFGVWLLVGQTVGFALGRAIAVLVISCPCALGLATPVAIMVGNGVGARHGILFKTSEALETTGKIRIAIFDKTGTVTRGTPTVTDLCPAVRKTEEELLTAAYAVEADSEHPLARAVVSKAEERHVSRLAVTEFRALPGSGVRAACDGKVITGGSAEYLASLFSLSDEIIKQAQEFAAQGKTPLLFAEDGAYIGLIAVADTVKEESAEAIGELRAMGICPVLLTGDNALPAQAIAKEAEIPYLIAGVRPEEKAMVIRDLRKLGKVAMIGDGINDAPALTAADAGIAIGAGTDVAIDAADVVLMHSRLSDVAAAVRLSRATLTNIRENLFWAFFYNALCIPLAAGCFIGLFGWALSPMIGAAAMSLSSFCVVTNALRLNLVKITSAKHDRRRSGVPEEEIRQKIDEILAKKEKTDMKKTMTVEGMMCPHCEAHVKAALEAIDGVESAVASHEAGTAVVTLSKAVADEALRAAVEGAGYKVTKIG